MRVSGDECSTSAEILADQQLGRLIARTQLVLPGRASVTLDANRKTRSENRGPLSAVRCPPLGLFEEARQLRRVFHGPVEVGEDHAPRHDAPPLALLQPFPAMLDQLVKEGCSLRLIESVGIA